MLDAKQREAEPELFAEGLYDEIKSFAECLEIGSCLKVSIHKRYFGKKKAHKKNKNKERVFFVKFHHLIEGDGAEEDRIATGRYILPESTYKELAEIFSTYKGVRHLTLDLRADDPTFWLHFGKGLERLKEIYYDFKYGSDVIGAL